MTSSCGIKVHVFHPKVNEFDKKRVYLFLLPFLDEGRGLFLKKRLTDKAKRLLGEAISQLSNQLYQTVTGGPIVGQPDGQTLKL